jgi:ornithine cyclodeaminase/alanine dehydrogenase-like protein (mu-crystallin family)
MKTRATVPAPVLLLDQATIESLISADDCIAAVESAFASHASGRSLSPQLTHVDAQAGEFHIKMGGLRDESGNGGCYFTCKTNGGFFGIRSKLGLLRAHANG